jgi:hypothetical protein
MAAATADAPAANPGLVGGLANTATQVGSAVGLAVLATVASPRAADARAGAIALAGYDRVFLVAAGLGLTIALVSLLLPRHDSSG